MLAAFPNSRKDRYRFTFNGKETDNEVSGQGNQYDYGFRIYNPRLARFLSNDPLSKSYPWYTPYQFAGNNPIWAIDLDGLEEYIVVHWMQNGALRATTIVRLINDWKVDRQSQDVVYVHMDAARLDEFVSQNAETGERSLNAYFRDVFLENNPGREDMIQSGTWERQFRPDERTMVFSGLGALDDLLGSRSSLRLNGAGGEVNIFEPFAPNISFESGSSELTLTQSAKAELGYLRNKMVMFPDMNVTIEGHTDDVGKESDNLALSNNRANAARDYVLSLGGVDGTRILTAGYGESRPIGDNNTETGRQQNRRIEIKPATF